MSDLQSFANEIRLQAVGFVLDRHHWMEMIGELADASEFERRHIRPLAHCMDQAVLSYIRFADLRPNDSLARDEAEFFDLSNDLAWAR